MSGDVSVRFIFGEGGVIFGESLNCTEKQTLIDILLQLSLLRRKLCKGLRSILVFLSLSVVTFSGVARSLFSVHLRYFSRSSPSRLKIANNFMSSSEG